MKEMEHIRPSGTFALVTPPPDSYETELRGNIIFAVDPNNAKPTLYFSFPARDRGWHREKSAGYVALLDGHVEFHTATSVTNLMW